MIYFNIKPSSFQTFCLSNPNPSYSHLKCFILFYSLLSPRKLEEKIWLEKALFSFGNCWHGGRSFFSVPIRWLKVMLPCLSIMDGQKHCLEGWKKLPMPEPQSRSVQCSGHLFKSNNNYFTLLMSLKLSALLTHLISFCFVFSVSICSLSFHFTGRSPTSPWSHFTQWRFPPIAIIDWLQPHWAS